MSVLAVVSVDLSLRVAFAIRDATRSVDYRAKADGYAGDPWVEAYFQEFIRSHEEAWHSYVYWRRPPFRGEFVNVDRRGLRKTWNPPGCAANDGSHTTIFMFGGSTTWGTGARDHYTIPSLLSRALAEDGRRAACVTNFGESGYVSSQELIALLLELRNGARPDLVVFLDGVNDAFAAFQAEETGIPLNEEKRRDEFNLSGRPIRMLGLAAAATVRRSGYYRLAYWANARLRRALWPDGPARAGTEELARRAVVTYAENLRLVENFGAAYGFQALFYWQPLVFTKARMTQYEAQEAVRERVFGKFYEKVGAAVAVDPSLAARRNFHDLSDLFAARPEPLFIDFAHLVERGNALVAERIAEDVRRMLGERAKSPTRAGAGPRSRQGEPRA